MLNTCMYEQYEENEGQGQKKQNRKTLQDTHCNLAKNKIGQLRNPMYNSPHKKKCIFLKDCLKMNENNKILQFAKYGNITTNTHL